MDSTSKIDNLKGTLEEIVDFLQQFHWLHNFTMIQMAYSVAIHGLNFACNSKSPLRKASNKIAKVLFKNGVINKLPEEWKNWFVANIHQDLLSYPYDAIDCQSLKTFLAKCSQYCIRSLLQTQCHYLSFDSVVREILLTRNERKQNSGEFLNLNVEAPIRRILKEPPHPCGVLQKVSPKKRHEIERISLFINSLNVVTDSSKILDIGSGRGFLDVVLHRSYNYKVLGAEACLAKVEAALKLKKKSSAQLCPDVNFISWLLENDLNTMQKSKEIITDLFESSPNCNCSTKSRKEPAISQDGKGVVLISLHSCGDLSPTMLEVFAQNDKLSSIVMMPCCYHKICPLISPADCDAATFVQSIHGRFKHFPMSKSLETIMEEKKFQINTCGLRIASEESLAHWKLRSGQDLSRDIKSIAYRSLLQSICDRNKIKLKKRRRHCTKKSLFASFHEYVEIMLNDYVLISENSDELTDFELLKAELYTEYLEQEKNISFVGFVRFLQLSLQPVIESLILIDQIINLKEIGFVRCGLAQLFDEVHSPRNVAIFAFRDQIDTLE